MFPPDGGPEQVLWFNSGPTSTWELHLCPPPRLQRGRYTSLTEGLQTCDDLPQLGVQVDGAGQEGVHVAGGEHGRAGGEEHLEAAAVPVDLQQWLHVLGGGDVLGDPGETETEASCESQEKNLGVFRYNQL